MFEQIARHKYFFHVVIAIVLIAVKFDVVKL